MIRPRRNLQRQCGLCACQTDLAFTALHEPGELQTSVRFDGAFDRMMNFLRGVVDSALVEDGESSDEVDITDTPPPAPQYPAPAVLLAAYNGVKFDFPTMVSECLRHG